MRKKSHILLARYLADQMEVSESLQSHRKAFCLGSILPDIRPSFLTKKHEFFGTIDEIEGKITRLVEVAPEERNERVYWRQFGEVIHYMADYFTFPHNKTYTGTLIEHGQYEKALKNDLIHQREPRTVFRKNEKCGRRYRVHSECVLSGNSGYFCTLYRGSISASSGFIKENILRIGYDFARSFLKFKRNKFKNKK